MDDIDVADAVRRVHGVLADPGAEPAALLDAIATLQVIRTALAGWEPTLVTAARDAGVSWADLAAPLGVTSRQAAERRYLRSRASTASDGRTREDRVRAERDRRAGDRAVNDWARGNSATLRRLAGRVGAAADLSRTGRSSADRVTEALGRDDAADLLGPLADAREHLIDRHTDLAAEIQDVTERTAALRRETQRGRRHLNR